MPFKKCSKCESVKSLSEFDKDRSKKDGHYSCCKQCKKDYRNKNLEHCREYYTDWYNKNSDYYRNYRKNNKENKNSYQREYSKNKRNTDPLYKLRSNISCLIRKSIKRRGYTKKSKTYEILGCDWNTLKEHIESNFDENMNWENQGTYWDIDHIIPMSSAKSEEDAIKLNHYTNLCPLESYYNRYVKRNKEV